MANTFLVAKGTDVAASLYDKDEVSVAQDVLAKAEAKAHDQPFVFAVPHDGIVASKIDKAAPTRIVDWGTNVVADVENYPKLPPLTSSHIQPDEMILDIGPFSAAFIAGGYDRFARQLQATRTIRLDANLVIETIEFRMFEVSEILAAGGGATSRHLHAVLPAFSEPRAHDHPRAGHRRSPFSRAANNGRMVSWSLPT